MFTPLLTFQIVACWVADTAGLGDYAWSPAGGLAVLLAPTRCLDQRRILLPIPSPPTAPCACNYAWQRYSSSTSPITWDLSGLLNHWNITLTWGHDTGLRSMFTPLLTFQIVACWVADTAGLGDYAWSPAGGLPVLLAPTRCLDQRRILLPIPSPPTAPCACNYAWQRYSSSTSPITWDLSGLLNHWNITLTWGHDTGLRSMFTPLLTFQVSYLTHSKQCSTSNYFLVAVSCPYDFRFRNLLCTCYKVCTLQLLSQLMLLLSGDVELNPGPTKAQIEALFDAIKKLDETVLTIREDINQLKAVQTNHETVLSTLTNRIVALETVQIEPSPNAVPEDAVKIKHEIETLKAANTDASNRLRRNNLLFFGIEDSAKESSEESELNVLNFCTTQLDIMIEPSAIERAHRIGKFAPDKTRPIVVKLAHFKTKEKILGCGIKLKETTFAVREDFAAATRLARAKLLKFIRPKKCAFMLRMDKLFVGNKTYLYDAKNDSITELENSPIITLDNNPLSQATSVGNT
ncbi:uncharacterized protein LOC144161012 [Haemaphysalis longicornis]